MSKKFNNKTLLIVFAVLLALFLLTRLLDFGKSDRNFRTDLVDIDTAQVTAVILYPKEDTAAIEIRKNGDDWQVQKGNITAQADAQAVESLLGTLLALEPQRLASRSQDKWKTFEVTDSLGTRVKIMNQDEILADLLVGKFSIQQMAAQQGMPPMQQQPKATSYVRLASEDEVYAVDGFLAASFNRSFNSWRDRTFLELDQNNITKISFTYPADSGFVAIQSDSLWQVDNAPADSTEMVNYLSRLANLNGNDFADDFSAEGKQPQFQASIEATAAPVTIEGYALDSAFVLRTSQRPDVYFRSDSSGLFSQIFIGKEKLQAVEN